MTRLSIACVLASASAFLGMRAPLPVKTPRVVKAPAVAMSSALAEESGVSLSSGGGMFTTSSPEDRRIGTELFVSGVRYRERRYPEVESAHRPQRCAEASKASTAAPRGASAARGAPVTKSSAGFRRLAGERERSPIQRNVGARARHTCDGAVPPAHRRRRRASLASPRWRRPRRREAKPRRGPHTPARLPRRYAVDVTHPSNETQVPGRQGRPERRARPPQGRLRRPRVAVPELHERRGQGHQRERELRCCV